MAILAFQKPDKVLMLEADDKYGKFEFRPLEPGFGITVGNALRRRARVCFSSRSKRRCYQHYLEPQASTVQEDSRRIRE